jgi:MFS family permease
MFNKQYNIFKRYDAPIWVRFFGTLLTKIAQFMMYPFLILYLHQELKGSVIQSTAILGLESLAGFAMNLWFGSLSDKYGRKPLMLLSLAIQGLTMTGLVFADSLWEVALLITLLGAGSYIFFPAADAQIADTVPEDQRAEVYSLLGMAANIGIALGPILGMFVFTVNAQVGFGFFALVSFLYFALVWWKIPESLAKKGQQKAKITEKRSYLPRLGLSNHKTLVWFTLLAVPTSMLAAQMWGTLPLHLKANFEEYTLVLTVIMVSQSTFSTFTQLWVGRKTEKLSSEKIIIVGYLLFAIAAIGFGFGKSMYLLVGFGLIYSLAGMCVSIHLQKFVSIWAPADMRGRYFSIFGLHWRISEMIGPVLGGIIFTYFGGEIMFSFFSLLLILCGVSQYRLIARVRVTRSTNSSFSELAN